MTVTNIDPLLAPAYQFALLQMVSFLDREMIPYQLTGGMAAAFYGSGRSVFDIDFDVPDWALNVIAARFRDNLLVGPEHHSDEFWRLELVTLSFADLTVDFSGTETTEVFDRHQKAWRKIFIDLSVSSFISYNGFDIKVIPIDDLIFYKNCLGREVDLLDIQALRSQTVNA
jgi:hypothetical protein